MCIYSEARRTANQCDRFFFPCFESFSTDMQIKPQKRTGSLIRVQIMGNALVQFPSLNTDTHTHTDTHI